MPRYAVHYIDGANDSLKISSSQTVEAASFIEALRPYTHWPVVETYDHTSACAQNPGTCIYHMEAWEAVLLPEGQEAPHSA